MADATEKQIAKIVKELLELKESLEKTKANLEHHVNLYNEHIRNLHIGR